MLYCVHCGTQNRDGSKFCNHCGARLTPQAGLVCPMCSAPNPVENVFCLKCNARLVPMTTPPEEKPPTAPPIKGLSLPTKSELTEESPDASSDSKEPDWLVNATPATDESGATQPDDAWIARLRATAALDDEAPMPNAGDTPDWLRAAEAPTPDEPPPSSEPAVAPSSPNWLDTMQASESAPTEQPSQADTDEPSWVAQLRTSVQTESPTDKSHAEIPDWLKPSQTSTPTEPTVSSTAPSSPVVEPSEAEPEWLKPVAAQAEGPISADEGVPDWLRSTSAPPSPSDSSAPVSAPTGQTAAPTEEVSDEEWLRRIQAGEGIQVPLAPTAPSMPTSTQPFADEDIPDWLRFATPVAKPEPLLGATPSMQPIEPAQVPDWIAALKPATEDVLPGTLENEPVEPSGPLAGLRGVLPLANAMAEPHMPSARQAASTAPRRSGAHLFETILTTPAASTTTPIKPAPRRLPVARWLISLTLLIAILVPLLLPPDLTTVIQPITGTPAREFFEMLDRMATPNTTMILAFDYEPGMAGEMDLPARALVRYLANKRVRLATLSTYEAGPPLAQRMLDQVSTPGKYEYGTQMVNLGYFAGNEIALANLATTRFVPEQRDWKERKPIRPFLESARVSQLSDATLVIVLVGTDDALRLWMEQVQPRGIKIAAVVSAGVEPRARAYRDAGQLVAQMAGLAGAAQFEILASEPGIAVRSAGAQNAAIGLMLVLLLLGNLAFVFARTRSRSEKG